jgi:hypothetical protein
MTKEVMDKAVAAQHAWFMACDAVKQAEAALVAAKDAYSKGVDAMIAEAGPDRYNEVMNKFYDRCLKEGGEE